MYLHIHETLSSSRIWVAFRETSVSMGSVDLLYPEDFFLKMRFFPKDILETKTLFTTTMQRENDLSPTFSPLFKRYWKAMNN